MRPSGSLPQHTQSLRLPRGGLETGLMFIWFLLRRLIAQIGALTTGPRSPSCCGFSVFPSDLIPHALLFGVDRSLPSYTGSEVTVGAKGGGHRLSHPLSFNCLRLEHLQCRHYFVQVVNNRLVSCLDIRDYSLCSQRPNCRETSVDGIC